MDPICHTLVGAALAEAGLKHRTRYATATLLIGANLPDVDVLSYAFGGGLTALAFRRGWTHGVLALAVLPVVLAGSRVRNPALVAAVTWAVLGGSMLGREAEKVAHALEQGELEHARLLVGGLCGREVSLLDEAGLARAVVESVAENTSDAVVGPLVWGSLCGAGGLAGFRAVNTLDAMVGHRNARYERFGKAAARLDDVLGWAPSRLTALLTVLAAPVVDGRPGRAWRVWRRDRHAHPSPNAGQCEAAFAGALGRTLGGANTYGDRVEHRPLMGEGPSVDVADIRRAVRLARTVNLGALLAVTLR